MNASASAPKTNSGLGMVILFLTEMWERFSFYGMKALLVPFLMAAFEYTEPAAKEMLGTYVLLVYLSPLFAGIIADRFLNLRTSIYVGAIVMAVGHFAMAFHEFVFVGMALIIAGNGFFKPCATNMVGALYPGNHPFRSSAYSLFYFGINLGAFISPFVCGWLRENHGFDWGFAAAGVGMLVGLLVFLMYEGKLGRAGLRDTEDTQGVRVGASGWRKVMIATVITTVLVSVLALGKGILNYGWTPKWLLGEDASQTMLFLVRMAVVLVLLWVYTKMIPKTDETRPFTPQERDRVWVIAAISFAMFFLVIALEQAGGTLNLFAKDKTQETLLGMKIPYEFYQSANPLAVMIFSLLTIWLWRVLEKRGVTDVHKVGPGLLLVAAVFFLMHGADNAAAGGERVSPGWLLSIYTLIGAAEVCISVVGLSVVNKLAPNHMKAFFTAVFFLAIAIGGYLAGTVDQILHEQGLDPWMTLTWVSLGLGVVYMFSAGKLRRLSHGIL